MQAPPHVEETAQASLKLDLIHQIRHCLYYQSLRFRCFFRDERFRLRSLTFFCSAAFAARKHRDPKTNATTHACNIKFLSDLLRLLEAFFMSHHPLPFPDKTIETYQHKEQH